jgi:hypothetical protein
MKDLREQYMPGVKPERVAELARTSRPSVSRMEGGVTLPRFHLFTAILGVYPATEQERERALELWEYADADTTVIEHEDDLRAKYLAFRWDESEAAIERTIDPIAVPGLLQTAGYAAAVGEAGRLLNPREDWEERAADERQSRQRLLDKENPLQLHSLIDEAAIRRTVGGPDVMAEQLAHLLAMGKRNNVTIQVVPFGAGAYGTMSGPVIILGFEDEDPDIGYLEYAAGGTTVEEADDVAAFMAMFNDVQAIALPPKRSAGLIQEVLDQLKGR